MSTLGKVLWLEAWFLIGFPFLGCVLFRTLGLFGLLLQAVLFVIWCWEIFAFCHYRFCRQEEFLAILQTAAATQAPVEKLLTAYLADRPQERLSRGFLLFFVFPGYYWLHLQRSFDVRLGHLVDKLYDGVPLDQALCSENGVVSREIALAATIGQYSGRLPQALHRLGERRLAPQLLGLVPRLLYPLLLLFYMVNVVAFMVIFIIPKYERIFLDFKAKLPFVTQLLIDSTRWLTNDFYFVPLGWLLLLILLNVLIFSSRVQWHFPVVSTVYRLYARGKFLQMLGLMMESGKPLPAILDRTLVSGLLPPAVATRVVRLAGDLEQGQPLTESLIRHGLMTRPMVGLVMAAEKAQNLPWALQELGDSLVRRSARISYRLVSVIFPLSIFACACLVGFVALALFEPLIAFMESVNG